MASKSPGQFRPGKTARDRAKGSIQRCVANKLERANWQNDTKRGAFPYKTCNGKRNRRAN